VQSRNSALGRVCVCVCCRAGMIDLAAPDLHQPTTSTRQCGTDRCKRRQVRLSGCAPWPLFTAAVYSVIYDIFTRGQRPYFVRVKCRVQISTLRMASQSFCCFSSVPQENFGMVPRIRRKPLSSSPFAVRLMLCGLGYWQRPQVNKMTCWLGGGGLWRDFRWNLRMMTAEEWDRKPPRRLDGSTIIYLERLT
jgi:hypothetical protein